MDGRTAHLEYRYAAGGLARFAPLAKEMVALKPDVIFVQSTGFAAAVHRETRTIPVVFANVSDPLGAGFVESLARPGAISRAFCCSKAALPRNGSQCSRRSRRFSNAPR